MYRQTEPRGLPLALRLSEGLGGIVVPAPEVLNVLNVGLAGDCKALRLKPTHAELHPIERHHFIGMPADVTDELRYAENPARDRCLELCVACEDNGGLDCVGRQEVK